jgi:lysophospholipase L1-like esterase
MACDRVWQQPGTAQRDSRFPAYNTLQEPYVMLMPSRTKTLPLVPLMLLALCLVLFVVPADSHDGDINLDGAVDVADLLWGLQGLQGSRTLLPEEECHADVAPLAAGVPGPDELFNTGDIAVLLRMLFEDLRFGTPGNQFNIGDSIGEGEAAYNSAFNITPTPNHETVWSTGYDGGDSVNSLNERFENSAPVEYYENNSSRDGIFNLAESGAVMADFLSQVQGVIAAASLTPSGEAGMVTVLLGSNDVCAPSNLEMTDPGVFETQFRAGLEELAASEATRLAQIHVSGIPAIYWLWVAKYDNFVCQTFIWPFVPCQNLLENANDNDCVNSASSEDPDTIYPGDGGDCERRKLFHAAIRDTYNPALSRVVAEYRESGKLPNIRYTDIFDVRFYSEHVNNGDCFHPSEAGHALLAENEWSRTHWGHPAAACTP